MSFKAILPGDPFTVVHTQYNRHNRSAVLAHINVGQGLDFNWCVDPMEHLHCPHFSEEMETNTSKCLCPFQCITKSSPGRDI